MQSFSQDQLLSLDHLLRTTARAEIMPKFRHLSAGQTREKTGPADLVTDADEAAEAVITEALQALYPGCLVLGEEAASRDPALLDRLAAAELAFTVDPIDGTSNYAAGLPLFGTMAAVVQGGRVTGAVIHDPMADSSSTALLGQGAWEVSAAGVRTRLRVARAVPVGEMSGAASWRFLPPALRATVLPNLAKLAQVYDFRCAAHEYRMLVAGHCHFLMFNRLMPWDHLPGCLIHAEAGGYAARFDGSAYVPGMVDGGLICAADRGAFEAFRRAVLF